MPRPVVVTTEYRGVFFGYTEDSSGDSIVLTQARNCIYWDSTIGGFMGLAVSGPTEGCKIGETAPDIDLRKVTSVMGCTPMSEAAWCNAPVYRGDR